MILMYVWMLFEGWRNWNSCILIRSIGHQNIAETDHENNSTSGWLWRKPEQPFWHNSIGIVSVSTFGNIGFHSNLFTGTMTEGSHLAGFSSSLWRGGIFRATVVLKVTRISMVPMRLFVNCRRWRLQMLIVDLLFVLVASHGANKSRFAGLTLGNLL